MRTIYGDIPQSEIEKQKKYFYGAIISLLYLKEENYKFLDQRIQTIINQISGSMKLFNSTPEILSIIAWLEDSRVHKDQFRKNILDAANMVDKLKGGDSYV
jgi:ABC-type oligopeptide transport system ATPase subunit